MAKPKPRATLQTIADAVGVSRATVSNAYNRPDQLTAKLRERILATARELGYPGPDPAARRLRHGGAGAIGVVLTERLSYAFSDPAAVAVLEGLARRCEEARAGLLLIPVTAAGEGAERVVRDAVADGFCVYSLPDGHPAVAAVLERRLPAVMVDEPRVDGAGFVGVDDREGGRLAAAHLVELGHRRVASIVPTLVPDERTGPVDASRLERAAYHVDRERLEGIRAGLGGAPLATPERPVHECANGQDAAAAVVRELLTADARPTAIVATTDQLALGAVRACAEHGLEVGRDVSVVGFDDVPEAARAGLTTIHQPLVEKGDAAGRLLIGAGGELGEAVELPVELAVRASTGPPAAG
jgi:DNA-binding LacI/PurR family transcriptional regulator